MEKPIALLADSLTADAPSAYRRRDGGDTMLFKEKSARQGRREFSGPRPRPIEDATALRLRIHQRLLEVLNLSLLDKTPRETSAVGNPRRRSANF